MSNKGLDIGTNMLVAGMFNEDGNPSFKLQRDAFFRIVPKTDVNRTSIRLSLDKRKANYFIEDDGNFVVVGQDALEIAIERNDKANRPMARGVISPKEKASFPMLKLIIEGLIGEAEDKDDKVIFSVPAKPVDSDFDITYHTEMMSNYINKLGYKAFSINESFAIALSELIDDSLTGVACSLGSGMINVVVVHEGDPLIEFSITRAGDYIDNSVGVALDMSPSLVQLEKEAGTDLLNPTSKVMEAVSIYYSSVIKYMFKNISFELSNKEKDLPSFRNPIPIVFAGGLTCANGFIEKANQAIEEVKLPFEISETRVANDPMKTVANGCLLATTL